MSEKQEKLVVEYEALGGIGKCACGKYLEIRHVWIGGREAHRVRVIPKWIYDILKAQIEAER